MSNLKLHYMVKRESKIIESWPTWKEEKNCSDAEKSIANLRTLHDDEIILDIEQPEQLDPIIKRLIEDEYNFQVWATGSRGYHIRLIFPEMAIHNE